MDIIVKPISQIQEENHSELLKQAEHRQAFIDGIKAEIGEDVDSENLTPLFSQLES